jgi:hypothetical protein
MNIVRNLRASKHIDSICIKLGFRYCVNVAGMSPPLDYLTRVFIMEFNSQNRMQVRRDTGSLS